MERAELHAVPRRAVLALAIGLSLFLGGGSAVAQQGNAPGVTDKEIKIGQTMPYSGPASLYGNIGKAESAYFDMINAQGGVDGRKINLISLDDGYSPPKAVEQIRRLVEQDEVAFIFQSLGTANNTAFRKYLNDRKIPQLFLASGASKWNDPEHFPWTMSWQPNYHTETVIYVKYILDHKPDAKIGVLYQNDDFGKDYLESLHDALGPRYDKMVVAALAYESTDPTVDTQIVQLQSSGADTFIDATSPKFAAQAIRKAYDIGWKPLHILNYNATSIGGVLKPAGLEKSEGVISVGFLKDPNDAQWKDDPGMKEWRAFMAKYYPSGDLADGNLVYAYLESETLVQVLKQCGNDLSRENIMKQAANLHDLHLSLLLPGMSINTSPSDYRPLKQMQMIRFNGTNWELFGDLISSEN
jgi:ABC-type branched-subunit amino acid transport system substrate-binding protein